MSVDAQGTAASSSRRPLIRKIIVIGCLVVVAAGYATAKLYQYSDPNNADPSPAPRQGLNAPFITTADPVINKMIELAQISDKDLVYDLGCGDGRIVIAAAVQSGCRGVGFDINPVRVTEAQENAKLHGVEKTVTFEEQDVFKVDLSKADVIVAYLLPWMLRDLKPSFDQCPPGTRIVSHDFEIEDVQADEVIPVDLTENDRHYVRLYTTPLKRLPPRPKRKFIIE
jgi:SAM-dependent methyltransferase